VEVPINLLFKSFVTKRRNVIGLMFLRIGFSLALLGKVINQIDFVRFAFDPRGPNYLSNKSYLYNFFFTDWGYYLYVGISLLGAIFFLIDKLFYVGTLLSCLSYLISSAIVPVGHGGDAFARLVYPYLILTVPDISLKGKKINSEIRLFLHNVGVISIYIQGVLVYFTAGLSKIPGEVWQEGTALYYILGTERFGSPFLYPIIKNAYMTSFLTYSVLLFQIGFPFMLLSKYKFSLLWAILGIFIHLGIAIFMGLWLFSLIIISYTLFTILDSDWRFIGHKVSKIKNKIFRVFG
jgi:hypothetical protein